MSTIALPWVIALACISALPWATAGETSSAEAAPESGITINEPSAIMCADVAV